jgi:tetratricopeptide (TPR) repeat protein
MSLKAELETWAAALKAYDEEDFEQSLELFSVRLYLFPPQCPISHPSQTIADSSKILTNMGLIYATLGEHETAVEQFIAATRLDNYLAVASVLPYLLPCSFSHQFQLLPMWGLEFPAWSL